MILMDGFSSGVIANLETRLSYEPLLISAENQHFRVNQNKDIKAMSDVVREEEGRGQVLQLCKDFQVIFCFIQARAYKASYPTWALSIGIMVFVVSFLFVPGGCLYHMYRKRKEQRKQSDQIQLQYTRFPAVNIFRITWQFLSYSHCGLKILSRLSVSKMQ